MGGSERCHSITGRFTALIGKGVMYQSRRSDETRTVSITCLHNVELLFDAVKGWKASAFANCLVSRCRVWYVPAAFDKKQHAMLELSDCMSRRDWPTHAFQLSL